MTAFADCYRYSGLIEIGAFGDSSAWGAPVSELLKSNAKKAALFFATTVPYQDDAIDTLKALKWQPVATFGNPGHLDSMITLWLHPGGKNKLGKPLPWKGSEFCCGLSIVTTKRNFHKYLESVHPTEPYGDGFRAVLYVTDKPIPKKDQEFLVSEGGKLVYSKGKRLFAWLLPPKLMGNGFTEMDYFRAHPVWDAPLASANPLLSVKKTQAQDVLRYFKIYPLFPFSYRGGRTRI